MIWKSYVSKSFNSYLNAGCIALAENITVIYVELIVNVHFPVYAQYAVPTIATTDSYIIVDPHS